MVGCFYAGKAGSLRLKALLKAFAERVERISNKSKRSRLQRRKFPIFGPRQRRYVIRPSVWGEGQFPILLKRSQNQVPEGRRNDYNGKYCTIIQYKNL